MSTKKEVTLESTATYSIKAATKVKLTFMHTDDDGKVNEKDLFITGVSYDSEKGFSMLENVPTTLKISNLIVWIGGAEKLSDPFPAAVKKTVKERVTELITADASLDMDNLNINPITKDVEFGVVIPGLSIDATQLGLPTMGGLKFKLENITVNIKRKVS